MRPRTKAGTALLDWDSLWDGVLSLADILAVEDELLDRVAVEVGEAIDAHLNDRSAVGYHDDFRPYIRARNVVLAAIERIREDDR